MNSLKATYSYITMWFRSHPLLDLSQWNKIIFLCNSDLTHGHRSVGHPLFKEATGVINLLYRTMTMVMNRNTHLCNFKSDTTIILTRNVTWNSSAPNATPITSYPLTRAMAGGAPCWPAQHCHLRAKALLNWLQPYSLVAWNREACLMSLLKFNMNIFPRWPEMLLLQTEVKQVAILVAQNFLHKINIGK